MKVFSRAAKAAKGCRSPERILQIVTGLLKGLGADANVGGRAIMAYEQLQRWGRHNIEYSALRREVLTVAKTLAVAGVFALTTVVIKFFEKSERRN